MKTTASAASLGSNVGSALTDPSACGRAGRDPLGHRGVRVADVDLAAGDVVGPPVERDRLGQAGDPVLGHRVADRAGPRRVGGDRAVVDDPAAHRTLRLHQRDGVVRAQERAGEVGGHDRLPALGADLVHRPGRGAGAGVVDQQVEPAEAVADGREQRRHRVLVGDVGPDREDHLRQRLLHGVFEQLEAAAGRDDVPPLVGQRDRDEAAEPGTCAGDDRHLLSCHAHYRTTREPAATGRRRGGGGTTRGLRERVRPAATGGGHGGGSTTVARPPLVGVMGVGGGTRDRSI